MVFDKQWFTKHQKKLLLLANSYIGKRILCIDGKKSSVGNNKIVKIEPNAITWIVNRNEKEVKLATEFRTHAKFSKRLYYTFKPLWYLAHYFDLGIANNLNESLNLGFDTLTSYPDADPETSTVDGRVGRTVVNETFSTIRAGAGNLVADNAATVTYSLHGSTTTNQYQGLTRSIFLFDTSSLTSNANISQAIFSYYVTSRSDVLSNGNHDNSKGNICAVNPASNTSLATSDYGNFSDTSFGASVVQNSLTDSSYENVTLNSSGISAISKTGITKFGLRYGWDLSNTLTGYTWASGGFQAVVLNTADQTGIANDPKLVITYTLGSANFLMFF